MELHHCEVCSSETRLNTPNSKLIGGDSMEKALEKLAEQILSFDEASLVSLREKYRLRIEHFDGTKDWEKAVMIYCIINAVSLKNTLFNENVLRRKKEKEKDRSHRGHPPHGLKRVK
jgi:hypothetical protein